MRRVAALSDRIHPLIVRDVRRAFRTRSYTLGAAASCAVVVAIALLAVDRQVAGLEVAQWTLRTTLTAMSPVLLFAIPLHAFAGLRAETEGASADQLVLAGLRPTAVVFGFMATALLQSLVLLGFFAPLLGFSYLLLGVDLPTLLQALLLAPLSCVVATGVLLAAVRLRCARQLGRYLPSAAVVIVACIALVLTRRMEDVLALLRANARGSLAELSFAMLSLLLAGGLIATFCALIAAGALTPLPEARAVRFRLLGVVAAPTATLLLGGGVEGAVRAAVVIAPLWFLAATEPLGLTRRQIPLVPRDRRRLRLAPFLPGAPRGLLYAGVLGVTCALSGLVTGLALERRAPDIDGVLRLLGMLAMTLAYAGYCCNHRLRGVEHTRVATAGARLGLVRRFVLLWVAAVILDAWTIGVAGSLRALVSVCNPLVFAGAPELLPNPGVVLLLTGTAATLLVGRNLPALQWSFAELRAPGRTQVPAGLVRAPRPTRSKRRPRAQRRPRVPCRPPS